MIGTNDVVTVWTEITYEQKDSMLQEALITYGPGPYWVYVHNLTTMHFSKRLFS